MADQKVASQTFLKERYGTCGGHAFSTIEECTAGMGRCFFHERGCALKTGAAPPDIVVLGPPCQPYSNMRPNRTTQPHEHPLFDVLFEKVIAYIEAVRPAGGIIEEVPGFASTLAPGTDSHGLPLPTSWLSRLLGLLGGFGYSCTVLRFNNNVWTEAPRDRLAKHHSMDTRCFQIRTCSTLGLRAYRLIDSLILVLPVGTVGNSQLPGRLLGFRNLCIAWYRGITRYRYATALFTI
jgi:hypothetical protein